jgi:hypothetical protein
MRAQCAVMVDGRLMAQDGHPRPSGEPWCDFRAAAYEMIQPRSQSAALLSGRDFGDGDVYRACMQARREVLLFQV